MKYLLTAFSWLVYILTLGRLKYSRPVEGNAETMSLGEKLWWGYKFYGHPIHEPERNKGIREHFEANPPTGFIAAADDSIDVDSLPSLTIGLAGDILPVKNLEELSPKHLDNVRDFFQRADIRCANLESPVHPGRPLNQPSEDISAPPEMNNSPETVEFLLQRTRADLGPTVFSTANNHSLDQGPEGVVTTLDFLDERGLLHTGTARSPEEADTLLLVEEKGFKIAFLSWTFGLNGKKLPAGQEYLVNTFRINLPGIDISPVTKQVDKARQSGADFVILLVHWGLENESFPLASQIETAHRLAASGIDVICGNHPHTSQPAERYVWQKQADSMEQEDDEVHEQEDSVVQESLILYALGDLVSPLAGLGLGSKTIIVELKLLRRNDGKVVIYDANLEHIDSLER